MMYHDILRRPIISENSMEDIANKKYTFEVAAKATKVDIKNAVERFFITFVKYDNALEMSVLLLVGLKSISSRIM